MDFSFLFSLSFQIRTKCQKKLQNRINIKYENNPKSKLIYVSLYFFLSLSWLERVKNIWLLIKYWTSNINWGFEVVSPHSYLIKTFHFHSHHQYEMPSRERERREKKNTQIYIIRHHNFAISSEKMAINWLFIKMWVFRWSRTFLRENNQSTGVKRHFKISYRPESLWHQTWHEIVRLTFEVIKQIHHTLFSIAVLQIL